MDEYVVYRTIPTSNHNRSYNSLIRGLVVYRTIPTSNHNCEIVCVLDSELYIVLFLHQTTTSASAHRIVRCCISYYSYIKPQLRPMSVTGEPVVYRTIPTSNHNLITIVSPTEKLYIVLFLHQTTTVGYAVRFACSLYIVLFLHQTTTSLSLWTAPRLLYIVLFLHQTTTYGAFGLFLLRCISYYSYIKPQQDNIYSIAGKSCISYYSYIKPQLGKAGKGAKFCCISYYSYIKPQPIMLI